MISPAVMGCSKTYAVVVDGGIVIALQIFAQPHSAAHSAATGDSLFKLLDPGIKSADLVSNVCDLPVQSRFELIESLKDDRQSATMS